LVSEICGESETVWLALPETVSVICGETVWSELLELPGLSVIPKEFVWNGLKVCGTEFEICGEVEAAALELS
jgi:hypothetical protein